MMDMQINPDQPRSVRRVNPYRRKQDNSLLLVALRTLICILIIDLSIWGYFEFVKGVSFTEGIKSWQTSSREFLSFQNKQDHSKIIVKQKPITYPRKQTEIANSSKQKIKKNYLYKINLVNGGKIEGFKLIDKGDIYEVYSKQGIVTEINKGQIKKINRFELVDDPHFETKYTYKGGTILIPVTVTNNGHKETIKLILDTGCGTTQIHPDVIKRLRVKIDSHGKSFVADGRTINKSIGRVDFLEVGPFKEQNFIISTNYIENKHGIDGLLGMNFLRKHPFDIDTKKQVVRWK